MKNLGLTLLAITVLAAMFSIASWSSHWGEPVYQGRTISAWIERISDGRIEQMPEYQRAMSHFGTNAVPYVRKMIHYPESSWGRSKFRRILHLPPTEGTVFEIHNRASWVCAFMPPTVRGELVGDWLQLVGQNSRRDYDHAMVGCGWLEQIGLAALAKGSTNSNPSIRQFAVVMLEQNKNGMKLHADDQLSAGSAQLSNCNEPGDDD